MTLSVGVLCFSHIRAEWLASEWHGQAGVCTKGSPGSAKTDAKCVVTSIQGKRWSVTQEDVSSRYHVWLSGARAATGLCPRAVGTAGSGVSSHSSWASCRWDVGRDRAGLQPGGQKCQGQQSRATLVTKQLKIFLPSPSHFLASFLYH